MKKQHTFLTLASQNNTTIMEAAYTKKNNKPKPRIKTMYKKYKSKVRKVNSTVKVNGNVSTNPSV